MYRGLGQRLNKQETVHSALTEQTVSCFLVRRDLKKFFQNGCKEHRLFYAYTSETLCYKIDNYWR